MKPRHKLAAAIALAVVLALAGGWWWWQQPPARYFELKEVERAAYPLKRIDLEHPPGREGVDYYGTLRMDVMIDHRGGVDAVEVRQATVPAAFRDAAVKAFGEARYEPAVREGRKVKSVKRVEVRFAAPLRELDASQPSER
jgi:hypothetical protein